MQIEHRSYSGRLFRPKPEIHNEGDQLALIITPWGSRATAKKVIQVMTDYILSALSDDEATSPFEKILSLTPTGNLLRTAALLANESVYEEENRSEWVTGVEVVALATQGNEINILQIGHPALYHWKNNFSYMPLASHLDWSYDFSSAPKGALPPLPRQLLGIAPTIYPTVLTMRRQKKDHILLVSHTFAPQQLFQQVLPGQSLESITQQLNQFNEELPFWLARIEF